MKLNRYRQRQNQSNFYRDALHSPVEREFPNGATLYLEVASYHRNRYRDA